MQRILLAVLAVAWLQVTVRAEENDAPEVKLANLEVEAHEIASVAEAGDLLRTNWNLRGVEVGSMIRDDNTSFRRSPPATTSVKLETQIATGEWARRLAVSNAQLSRCRTTCDEIPATRPQYMSLLSDDFWPLTRSAIASDTHGEVVFFNSFMPFTR